MRELCQGTVLWLCPRPGSPARHLGDPVYPSALPPGNKILQNSPGRTTTNKEQSFSAQGSDVPPVSPPVLVQSRKTGPGGPPAPHAHVHVCARMGVCMCAAVKPGCTHPTHSTFGRTNKAMRPHWTPPVAWWGGRPYTLITLSPHWTGDGCCCPLYRWTGGGSGRLRASLLGPGRASPTFNASWPHNPACPTLHRALVFSRRAAKAGRVEPGATRQLGLPWAPLGATF